MAVIVQKYGGSSVSDLTKIRAVGERIAQAHRAGNQVVVVVSAMGNTTNELLSLAHELSVEPDRRELDMLVSVGERVSMALLAIALRDLGVPARSLTGSQSGIITDESHANARVLEVRPARIQQCLQAGDVVIVAGFQGVSREREVTTLGRGGSDTTAVVLAAALQAEYCEICSDVDGVWSADPRLVAEATRLDSLSLNEALTLSRAGAKVLFEDAVAYARENGVMMVASATFGPGAGTRLTPIQTKRLRPIAVSGDSQIVRLSLPDEGISEMLATMRKQGAKLRRRVNSCAWFDVRNVHGAAFPGAEATAIVSAVGQGIGEDFEVWPAGTSALAKSNIDVLASASAGDEVWWEICPTALNDALCVLHRTLVAAD